MLSEATLTNMKASSIADEIVGWRRVVIKQTFGRDMATAQALIRIVHNVFRASQVYRIDHYLSKETVQSLMVFRFRNTIFEPIRVRQYVESVQITVAGGSIVR